jgi:hypothetical protein
MRTSFFRISILLYLAVVFSSCEAYIYLYNKKIDNDNKRKALEEAQPYNIEDFKVSLQGIKDYSGDGKISPGEAGYLEIQYQNVGERTILPNERALQVSIVSSDPALKFSVYGEFALHQWKPGRTETYRVGFMGENITEEKNVAITAVLKVDGQTKVHHLGEVSVTSKPSNDLNFVSAFGISVKSIAGKYLLTEKMVKGAKLHLKDDGTFDYFTPHGIVATAGKWRIIGILYSNNFHVNLIDGVEFYDFKRISNTGFLFHAPSPLSVSVRKEAYDAISLDFECIFKIEDKEHDSRLVQLNKIIVGGWKLDVSDKEYTRFRFYSDHRYEYYLKSDREAGAGTGRWEFVPTQKEDGTIYHSLLLSEKEPNRSPNRFVVKAVDAEENQIKISPHIACFKKERAETFVMTRDNNINIDLSKRLDWIRNDTPSSGTSSPCSYCGGAGYTREWGPCRSCHGTGKSRF